MVFIASVALVAWGVFNLYPQLMQTEEGSEFRSLPPEKLWTYGLGIEEGARVVYSVYHVTLVKNITASFSVVDTDAEDGRWKILVEVNDGEMSEKAYVLTRKSILPTSGSQILGELRTFAIATRMPIAEFIVDMMDQPLVVGANWEMAFLSPRNSYTWSSIVGKEDVDGKEAYVLRYGPEKMYSLAWIVEDYSVPLRDEYKDPLSGEIISVYELIEYKKTDRFD